MICCDEDLTDITKSILKDCECRSGNIIISDAKLIAIRLDNSEKPRNAKEYIAQKKAKSAKQRHVNKPKKLM